MATNAIREWSSWVFDVAWSNGIVLGVGFVAVTVWRQLALNEQSAVTKVRTGPPRFNGRDSRREAIERFIDLRCSAQLERINSWLQDPASVCCVLTSSSSELRRLAANRCLAQCPGVVIDVNLAALPVETVSNWIPRLGEANKRHVNWNVFATAFEQLYSLLRGSGLEPDRLVFKRTTEDPEEAAVLVGHFREALRLVEADLLSFKAKYGQVVLLLHGMETFSAVATTEVGRRSLSVFLEWLRRIAREQTAMPLLTCDSSFFLENMIWSARLRDARLVTLCAAVSLDNIKELYPDFDGEIPQEFSQFNLSRLNLDEIGAIVSGDFRWQLESSRTRYYTSLSSSKEATRFAPLDHSRADAWSHDEFQAALLMVVENEEDSNLERLLGIMSPKAVLYLLRCELLEYDPDSFHIRLPRASDRIAVRQLHKEGILQRE